MDFSTYADIVESTKKITAIKASHGFVSSLPIEDTDEKNHFWTNSIASSSAYRYTFAIDDVEVRQDTAITAILKSQFVSYGITVKRSSDNEEHVIWKRFKEMRTFYERIMVEFATLKNNRAIVFPTSGNPDSWLSITDTDPSSVFIQKRRLELQVTSIKLHAL